MPDSAIPYQATITGFSTVNGFMSIRYTADSSAADSNRPDIVRNYKFRPASLSDSYIQSIIKSQANLVVAQWNTISSADSDIQQSGFNDSGYVGSTYDFTYKPSRTDSAITPDDYNPKLYKVRQYESEGEEYITTSFELVALTGTEKREYREAQSHTRQSLWNLLRDNGHLGRVHRKLGSGDDVSASWDASTGAAFDFNNDAIASVGVSDVERVAEGTYRVIFQDSMVDANYTVTTGIGAENYTGAGSSPRQLTVISRAVDSLQVHCERTDDAVDEDNAYMAVQVAKQGVYDSAEIEFLTAEEIPFNSTLSQEIKSILGYSDDSAGDSDYCVFFTSN